MTPPASSIRSVPIGYTSRELPPAEWHRLPPTTTQLLIGEEALVAAVERDGELIACWPALTVIHADGAWIRPGYRKNPAVFRTLTERFFQMLRCRGVPQVLTVPQTPEVARILSRWGAVPLGPLYLLPIPAAHTRNGHSQE